MKNIDYFHQMTVDVARAIKWPFQKKRIARAYESVIDGAAMKEEEVNEKIIDLKRELTTAGSDEEARKIIKKIVDARMELELAQKVAEFARKEKVFDFDTEAKPEMTEQPEE